MHKVYLAGPIAGLTYDDAEDWRIDARRMLIYYGINGYSPLRNKDFLRRRGTIGVESFKHVMTTDRGIMTRDHYDCQTSDAIICNLLGATKVTIGSVMEIAWAFAYRKPLVAVMEESGNLHDHPMIREAVGYRVTTIRDACAVAASILLPAS